MTILEDSLRMLDQLLDFVIFYIRMYFRYFPIEISIKGTVPLFKGRVGGK